jgi:sec-independent protein translocase protein TatA
MNLGPAFFQNLGWLEVLIILAAALFFFGASRLPDLGRALAKTIREFKKGMKEDGNSSEKQSDAKVSPTDEHKSG